MIFRLSYFWRAMLAGSLLFYIFVFDRLTKIAAVHFLAEDNRSIAVVPTTPDCCWPFPCISFELVFNPGVSWGLFAAESFWSRFLLVFIIGALTALLVFLGVRRLKKGDFILPEVFIVAGALGNLFDRLMYQGVVDFIKISWACFSWPVFNVADMAIVFGVFLLIAQSFRAAR